ncbi:MAG: hypothetical protein V9G14_01065 [Cypionkella sp.]|nr:hypothetical protein [Cypionkella sp.]
MKRLITTLSLTLLLAAPASALTMDMSFANLSYPSGTDTTASQACTNPGDLAASTCATSR